MVRQRPSETFFAAAKERNVGIIARVPLASGLLTGKFSTNTTFQPGDHRAFTGDDVLDYGETFAGLSLDQGLAVVEELRKIFPKATPLSALALRWILMFEEVSCVIPGASRPEQIRANLDAAQLPPLTTAQMQQVRALYERMVWPHLAHRGW